MLITLISFIIVIGVLTLVHEFGHFITARRSGIVVDEFALGMGPMLFNRTVGETRYQVNLFPIGGYVKIAGMDGEEDDRANGFNSKPLSRRMMVIVAGSVMNLLLAALVFIILGMVGGRPVGVLPVVDRVIAASPADHAQIKRGDKILGVDGRRFDTTAQITRYISARPGKKVVLLIERNRSEQQVVLKTEVYSGSVQEGEKIVKKDIGRIGVVFKVLTRPMGFSESLSVGIVQTYELTKDIIKSLYWLMTFRVPVDAVSGPVGIARIVGDAARTGGIMSLLFWLAALSANVGVFNLLPLPALDGGRLAFLILEALRGGRKIDPKKEGLVHLVGLVLLLALIAAITLREIF